MQASFCLCLTFCSLRWNILELGGGDPGKKLPALPDPSFLQGHIPGDSSRQVPEQAQVFSPEVQGYGPAICLVPSSQDSELHNLIVTAAKAGPDLHIRRQPILLYKYKFQQSISPHWLLSHLHQDIIINDLQKPHTVLVPYCIVPSADIWAAEVSHEDQSLGT